MSIANTFRKLIRLVKRHQAVRLAVSNVLADTDAPRISYWGSITEEEEEGIKYAVAQASHFDGPIVEVGALFGHTTAFIACLKDNTVPLFAVDNFTWNPFDLTPEEHRLFLMRTIRFAVEHCATTVFDGSGEDFYTKNPDLKPSMVFIDAAHDYESVRRDIELALSTGCPVISGHDYSAQCPGVIRAVDEWFGKDVSLFGSVWVYESKKSE